MIDVSQFVILIGCNSRLQIVSVFFIGLLFFVNKSVMSKEAPVMSIFCLSFYYQQPVMRFFSFVFVFYMQCSNE